MPRYSSGDWYGIVTRDAVALLAPEVADAVVEDVWRAMAAGEGLGAVLGALVGAFGSSLGALPAFAVVTRGAEQQTTVVVRGVLSAEVTAADGQVQHVAGLGVTTWRELVVDHASRVTVALPAAKSQTLPVGDGVVRAASLLWDIETREPARPAEPAQRIQPMLGADLRADQSTVGADSVRTGATTILPTLTRDPEAEAESVSEATTGYDDLLFGETRIARVEDAAVREAEAPGELILGLPAALTSPASPAGSLLGDHDGETVSSAALAARHGGLLAAPVPDPGVAPASRPAPVLLVSPTGERVTLDRNAVVGRRPRALRATGAVPHLVTVNGPAQDISRSHVELRVDGSDLVAIDLQTTNGTTLRREGDDPVRLQPGEATLLVRGDRLDLGDGVMLSFEGLE